MKNSSTNQISKEFLDMKSNETQAVYAVYMAAKDLNKTPEEIKSELNTFLQKRYNFSVTSAKKVVSNLYNSFSKGEFQKTIIDSPSSKPSSSSPDFIDTTSSSHEVPSESSNIMLTSQDFQKFVELTQADSEITPEIKKLLLSFIVFYRRNFHPSGWIRYDRKNIFYLAGANLYSVSQQERMTKFLHERYALNMRVVGSNQPTPCYGFSWLQEQPLPGTPNNPYLTLAPLTPEGLESIIKKINK